MFSCNESNQLARLFDGHIPQLSKEKKDERSNTTNSSKIVCSTEIRH